MQLPNFARAGRYLLRYLPTYEEVPCGSIFAHVFRPNAHLIMPLLLSCDEHNAEFCPVCQRRNEPSGKLTVECECGLVYTPSSQSRAHIIMQLAHRKPLDELTEVRTTTNVNTAREPASTGPDSLGRLRRLPIRDQPRFKMVQNIKHVDFSEPPTILILDLLGCTYSVPWPMVSTAEKMKFFLQVFTAGGSVLDWGRDYILVDHREAELTAEKWALNMYPGISITLQLRDLDGQDSLRQTLVSRVRNLLSLSTQISRTSEISETVEQIYLMVGATSAQIEMRALVKEAVRAQRYNRPRRCENPTLPNTSSLSVCRICQQEYPTFLELAKHARCHLTVLKCERGCDTCDQQELPNLLDEDVDGRAKDTRSSSMMSLPPVDYRERGIARGSWRCCDCRQVNSHYSCPSRCPLDGHYKCRSCYVYGSPPPPCPRPAPRPRQ